MPLQSKAGSSKRYL